jgi:hypothetical protein
VSHKHPDTNRHPNRGTRCPRLLCVAILKAGWYSIRLGMQLKPYNNNNKKRIELRIQFGYLIFT